MTRSARLLAAGIAVVVVAAGIVALMRSDEPGGPAGVTLSPPAGNSVAITGDTVAPPSPAASTMASSVASTTTATVGAIDSTVPAVEFLEEPVADEASGGKSVSAEGDGQGDPVVQAVM